MASATMQPCSLLRAGRRTLSEIALHHRPLPQTCNRCISTSSFPTFEPSPNTELTTLLTTIRSKCILPTYLNPHQTRLIRAPKHASSLRLDPVTITLNDTEITLEHLDITKDIPSRSVAIPHAISLAHDPEDWENIARMIAGFQGGSTGLSDALKRKIITKLCEAEQIPLVLRMLREHRVYHISLKDDDVFNRVLIAIRRYAAGAQGGFDAERTRSALSFAEQLVDLEGRKEHRESGQRMEDGQRSFHTFGLALGLACRLVKEGEASQLVQVNAGVYAQKITVKGAIEGLGSIRNSFLAAWDAEPKFKPTVPLEALMTLWAGVKWALKIADDIEMTNRSWAEIMETELYGLVLEKIAYLEEHGLKADHRLFGEWEACKKMLQ